VAISPGRYSDKQLALKDMACPDMPKAVDEAIHTINSKRRFKCFTEALEEESAPLK